MKTRVLIADDHRLMVDGVRKLLSEDFDIVGSVTDGLSAVAAFESLRPDIMLLDVGLPLLSGIEVAKQVKGAFPNARIVFVTMRSDKSYVEEAFRAGARGYVIKNAAVSDLFDAISEALKGRFYLSPLLARRLGLVGFDFVNSSSTLFGGGLTPRQREVLGLIAEGKSIKEIAGALNISPRTVEFHRYTIADKLSLRTTAELTRYAIKQQVFQDLASEA